ncbi:TetR/AcrR family transcriptional regulator [Tepidiforma thermophila]|uniref:TetR family transcriptional regulator n=1 Tax=Tepidiforma thermophila (strain KCTC 52669 / CGMCC 1.13589 / G233) TaxID=2761530 RepID=A0A2A9HFR7_TEPT2|nr:TetR/AcrR family transcriptional regulator [Tepidiforma thermophila]PFG74628.1 TetR family transcriptional regulator [Tepidiforma thermophila]
MVRQEERRAKTRRQLVEAARRAVAARGFEGASLDAIAASAGLSKGAVYAHFPTKLDLYLAVVSDVLEEARRRLERAAEALAAGASPPAAAEAFLGTTRDAEHSALMLDIWITAGRERAVGELLDAFLAERSTLLGAAAIRAGQGPREALATAELVGRLIDAAALHARYRGAAAAGDSA